MTHCRCRIRTCCLLACHSSGLLHLQTWLTRLQPRAPCSPLSGVLPLGLHRQSQVSTHPNCCCQLYSQVMDCASGIYLMGACNFWLHTLYTHAWENCGGDDVAAVLLLSVESYTQSCLSTLLGTGLLACSNVSSPQDHLHLYPHNNVRHMR